MWIRFVRFKFRHELRGQSTDRACVKARGVTQQEAAKLLGTTQAQVSALMRCKPVSVSSWPNTSPTRTMSLSWRARDVRL